MHPLYAERLSAALCLHVKVSDELVFAESLMGTVAYEK
jgi:hypothetical protein